MDDFRVISAEHLSPEIFFGLEHALLTPDELGRVDDHLAVCAACREKAAARMNAGVMADDIDAALEAKRPAPAWDLFPFLAVAALLLVAAGSIWLFRRGTPQTAALNRAQGDSPAVRDALRNGRIPLPSFLEQLRPPREVLMGETRPESRVSLSPGGTAVIGPAVRFRWKPLAGPWSYQVQVYTLAGEPVVSGPEVSESNWSSGSGFPAGVDYNWQVVATRGSERMTLPQPPATPPRFRLLDSATSERLRALGARQPDAHLLLGVTYGEAGAIEDARSELTEALRLEPARSDVLRALLQSLDSAKQ